MTVGVASWQPGMRIEALDRKTPNLICVASICRFIKSRNSKSQVFKLAFNRNDYLQKLNPGKMRWEKIGRFHCSLENRHIKF